MNSGSKNKISILYLKSNQVKTTTISNQTRKIRDKINKQIKELGSKYFQVKAVFDQLNLHRDQLYLKGKELELLFKDQKKNLHLQTQFCRMKEALYCWYAENFYDEIFEKPPIFLAFLQKEADGNYIRTRKDLVKSEKSSVPNPCNIGKPNQKNLNDPAQQNRIFRQDKQIINDSNDHSTHIIDLHPVTSQIQDIKPFNQTNSIHQISFQEQNKELLFQPIQISTINSNEKDNYTNEKEFLSYDDICHNNIDTNTAPQNYFFNCDCNDIFYF